MNRIELGEETIAPANAAEFVEMNKLIADLNASQQELSLPRDQAIEQMRTAIHAKTFANLCNVLKSTPLSTVPFTQKPWKTKYRPWLFCLSTLRRSTKTQAFDLPEPAGPLEARFLDELRPLNAKA